MTADDPVTEEPSPPALGRRDAAPPPSAPPHIRPVSPQDGPAIHDLLRRTFDDVLDDRDRWLARWRWRCWDNPCRGDRPAGWVLAEGGQILGHLGAVYLPWRSAGERVTAVVGADYAVSDEAIARGNLFIGLELAQQLFTACRDDIVMATTANEKTGAVFGRYGCRPIGWTKEFWRAPATLDQLIRSCYGAENRLWRGLLSGTGRTAMLKAATFCYRRFKRRPAMPMPAGCRLETTMPRLAVGKRAMWEGLIAGRDEDSPGKAAAVEAPSRWGIDRTREYFEWRYLRHPERANFRVIVVRDAEDRPIGAAIVFREKRGQQRLMYVEELLVAPGRLDVVRSLLCAALRAACQHKADYLVTTTGHQAIRSVFWELGFESRARNAPAAVAQFTPASAPLTADANVSVPDDAIEFWHAQMF